MSLPFASLRLTGFAVFLAATSLFGASMPSAPPGSSSADWTADAVTHVYGFPDTAPDKKGTLTLGADALSFAGAAVRGSIARNAISAVSVGNDRVELWGTGGRILRMVIPNGGGLAAGAVMHHRVGMLTVEFHDARGAVHYAVFRLSAAEAGRALSAFTASPFAVDAAVPAGCGHLPVEPGSVLVDAPLWQTAEVPAAYRALLYEHLVDRLSHAKGITRVYRSGEQQAACPQYRVQVAVKSFKPGNQVVRASTGPVGMFAAATQIACEAHFTDNSGRLDVEEQVHSSVRTDSESAAIAGKLAKSLTKHFVEALKQTPTVQASR